MVDPLGYFSFQPVLHDWCNKGCYPLCGMMQIKESLLLIGKSSPCGGSGFPLSLSEWSSSICMTPYDVNKLSASLNKTFPSFLPKYWHARQHMHYVWWWDYVQVLLLSWFICLVDCCCFVVVMIVKCKNRRTFSVLLNLRPISELTS